MNRMILLLILPLFLFTSSPQAQSAERASFEFTCEATEDEFYDWIEAELWPVNSTATFGRNLDATFDILTDVRMRRMNWTITLTTRDCDSDLSSPGTELRRESLYSTIEDAHAEGHGLVLRTR